MFQVHSVIYHIIQLSSVKFVCIALTSVITRVCSEVCDILSIQLFSSGLLSHCCKAIFIVWSGVN